MRPMHSAGGPGGRFQTAAAAPRGHRAAHRRARWSRALLVLACALLGAWGPTACQAENSDDSAVPGAVDLMEIAAILREWTEQYRAEAPESLSLVVEFRIREAAGGSAEEMWHLTIAPVREVALQEGGNSAAAFIFSMSAATLADIHAGRLTAATAIAKAAAADRPPLVFTPTAEARLVPDMRGTMMEFLQRFFNPTRPERILLGEEHSRLIQGANVIPLYYAVGMRSAWYCVKPGQRLNERGDTHSYPQAYILVSGRGRLQIADRTVDVQSGESYYIPPGAIYGLWNEGDQPLELVWLAWGEGAW